jgi:hypothetical protein
MGEKAGRSGCGRSGDMVKYLTERRGISFGDACSILHIDTRILLDYRRSQNGNAGKAVFKAPEKAKADTSMIWEQRADTIAVLAHHCLSSEHGKKGADYLHSRGLDASTINGAELGYCREYHHDDATKWGFSKGKILLPRGVVIPWRDSNGKVVCIRFRRLPEDASQEARKYYGIDERTGKIRRYRAVYGVSTQHLYREKTALPGIDVVLLEGELDALATAQALNGTISVLATGSTSWGRSAQSLAKLQSCGQVLVCYDADTPGDKASSYWIGELSNAKRWRPLWSDANDMMTGGVDIAAWVQVGLTVKVEEPKIEDETPEPCSTLCVVVQNLPRNEQPSTSLYEGMSVQTASGVGTISVLRYEEGELQRWRCSVWLSVAPLGGSRYLICDASEVTPIVHRNAS